MKNPTCLWCGEEMREGVCGDAPVEYVCAGEGCPAEGVMIPPSMTMLPVEIEAWVVEYTFGPDDVYADPLVADWLGLFANELAAMEAGEKAFATMENAQRFHWEATPTILQFKRGAS